jgi:hypothetical protein
MSDTFDLPRDADGYLDMEAFPDDDLDPSASEELEVTLQDAPEPDDLDDQWDTLLDRALDPAAPAVSEELAPPTQESEWDDPFADVDDGDIPNPFADLDDDTDVDDGADDLDDSATLDAEQDDPDLDDPDVDLHADDSGLDDQGSLFDDDAAGDDHLDLTDDLDGNDVIDDAPVDDLDGLDALDSQLRDHGS